MPRRSSNAPAVLLSAEKLGFRRNAHEILRRQDIHLHVGEILHIVGDNGVGKTSLLKILAGLWAPQEGRVDLSARTILYIGHEDALSEELTVFEHLRLWYSMGGIEKIDLPAFASDWFSENLWHRSVRVCSAGERRKLSLLRLCLTEASVWLLDEPFQALDGSVRQRFTDLLRGHCRRGGGVVLTGHGERYGGGLRMRRHVLERL